MYNEDCMEVRMAYFEQDSLSCNTTSAERDLITLIYHPNDIRSIVGPGDLCFCFRPTNRTQAAKLMILIDSMARNDKDYDIK